MSLTLDILGLVQEEYMSHDECGYEIGCVLGSASLIDKIEAMLNHHVKKESDLEIDIPL